MAKLKCECGTPMQFSIAPSGSISASCTACKAQRFYKSPRAREAFAKRYGAPIDAPAATESRQRCH